MNATQLLASHTLSVFDYRCSAGPGDVPFAEEHRAYSLSYVRRGAFGCSTRGRNFELVSGCLQEASMFDHVGLKVGDLSAAVRFYAAALAPLGHVVCTQTDGYAGIGPSDAPALWLYATPGAQGTVHLAFQAKDRSAVDRFHAAGLGAGGRDNGAPGVRGDYAPHYYAAFLIDRDGNNVEAVCIG